MSFLLFLSVTFLITDLVAGLYDATGVATGDSSESFALRDSACLSTERDVFRVDNDFLALQLHLHEVIHTSGVYNHNHCRILLSLTLNISFTGKKFKNPMMVF